MRTLVLFAGSLYDSGRRSAVHALAEEIEGLRARATGITTKTGEIHAGWLVLIGHLALDEGNVDVAVEKYGQALRIGLGVQIPVLDEVAVRVCGRVARLVAERQDRHAQLIVEGLRDLWRGRQDSDRPYQYEGAARAEFAAWLRKFESPSVLARLETAMSKGDQAKPSFWLAF
jgi:hypothetical protein